MPNGIRARLSSYEQEEVQVSSELARVAVPPPPLKNLVYCALLERSAAMPHHILPRSPAAQRKRISRGVAVPG